MKNLTKALQVQFDKMCTTGKLFKSSISGNQVWNIYLSNFTKEDDPIFRDPESSVHNCNLCKNFVRRYGNIVTIDPQTLETISIWDFTAEDEYNNSVQAMSKILRESPIEDVFFETFKELHSLNYEETNTGLSNFRLGINKNVKRYTKEEAEKFGVVKPNEVKEFNHLYLSIPTTFVDKSSSSIDQIKASYRDAKNVFKRAMDEISLDTYKLVIDLIKQGSLLDGNTHLHKVEEMATASLCYADCTSKHKDNWAWKYSYNYQYAKFRNELIGVLCVELSQGEDLNKACQNWNKRVDPANYMKAVAPITEKQKKEAQKFVQENGYEQSFIRRCAVIEDIKASEILHINSGDGKLKEVSIFDSVKPSSNTQHKRSEFDKLEEVSIDKFMKDILPSCTSVEAYLENRMEGNMVSLTTSNIIDSKPIFKWDNNYSWTYNGNLAGKSQLRESVEARGGRVNGAFRFSHSWNHVGRNQSLMDLHVFINCDHIKHNTDCHDEYPIGNRVGWNRRQDPLSGGIQDVDYTQPAPIDYIPVENISFPSLQKMPNGKYICKIHNWNLRPITNSGFKAEIEFDGNIYQYDYPEPLKHKQWVTVAEVTLNNGKFSIEHKLPLANSITKEIYGLDSNKFHKVTLACLSPNYWGENSLGNKHYFFMLEGCKCPNPIRAFHNENLIADLVPHRKVLDALGDSLMIESTDKQLSGLGFNATVKDEIILKLQGSHKRMIKVKF